MRYALVAAALIGIGCGPQGDPTPLQGQAEAVYIAWNQIYGEARPAPRVYWRWDRCDTPNGIYSPQPDCTFIADGVIYSGLQSDEGWIEVGGPWMRGLMSDTSLAHELLHASIGDSDHHSAAWTTMLPQAEKAIAAAGL